jgi:hypothetical protein
MMNDECPHCGGKMIEKHDEMAEERRKWIQFIHHCCINCGKWIKKSIKKDQMHLDLLI